MCDDKDSKSIPVQPNLAQQLAQKSKLEINRIENKEYELCHQRLIELKNTKDTDILLKGSACLSTISNKQLYQKWDYKFITRGQTKFLSHIKRGIINTRGFKISIVSDTFNDNDVEFISVSWNEVAHVSVDNKELSDAEFLSQKTKIAREKFVSDIYDECVQKLSNLVNTTDSLILLSASAEIGNIDENEKIYLKELKKQAFKKFGNDIAFNRIDNQGFSVIIESFPTCLVASWRHHVDDDGYGSD